jgi:hypothetical protein
MALSNTAQQSAAQQAESSQHKQVGAVPTATQQLRRQHGRTCPAPRQLPLPHLQVTELRSRGSPTTTVTSLPTCGRELRYGITRAMPLWK